MNDLTNIYEKEGYNLMHGQETICPEKLDKEEKAIYILSGKQPKWAITKYGPPIPTLTEVSYSNL